MKIRIDGSVYLVDREDSIREKIAYVYMIALIHEQKEKPASPTEASSSKKILDLASIVSERKRRGNGGIRL